MTDILLVRHGRTTANAEGRLLGRLDPPLDDAGERQAAALAALLAPELEGRSPRIVSSPLLRTRVTAAVIAEAMGLPVEIDERWIELDYGELDGVALRGVPAETWATWRTDAEFCPAGGECLSALGRRVRAACDELVTDPAALVVVVTHVSPIKAAVSWALGVGDLVAWRMFVAPGSITRLASDVRGHSLTSFNQRP